MYKVIAIIIIYVKVLLEYILLYLQGTIHNLFYLRFYSLSFILLSGS